jgi:hypothetical protein
MNKENACFNLSRFIAIAVAGLLLTADAALAKGDGHHGDKSGKSGMKTSSQNGGMDNHSGKKKDSGKYSDKSGKNCGIVPMKGCGSSSKDPVGNTRPTTTGSNTPSGGGAGTPPAARPTADVRDHRPGGNAPVVLSPGTIVRDHRNGADGTPMKVISSAGGVTVYRPVKPAPKTPAYYTEVPFVH